MLVKEKSLNTILVAEDNNAELRLLQIAMERTGLSELVNIKVAYNGEEAIERIEEALKGKALSLILLDLNMPKIPGKAVLQFLQNTGSATPVIILSNSDNERDIKDCFQLGANGYFTKPSHFNKLEDFCLAIKNSFEKYNSISVEFVHRQMDSLKIKP